MRILFVLPAPVRVPSGGAAVVYQHAVGLAERGHEVTVAAPRRMTGARGVVRTVVGRVRNLLHHVPERPLHQLEGVETVEVSSPRQLDPSGFDSVIATGHQTAPWVHHAMGDQTSGRVYFIQGDERYQTARAEATWSLPFTRVTVSQWLADTLQRHGASVASVVPNAVDSDIYRPTASLSLRERRVVALYHPHPVKGPDTLIDSLKRLRALDSGVGADIISARPPRHRFPDWVSVHIRPSPSQLVALYNRASVCLHTSRLEGWGLVPMEAAACGCAVVATASRGVCEFLRPGRSMLQVEVGDAEGLATQAAELLAQSADRVRLATQALEDVARFSWAESTARLEHVLIHSI